MNKDEVYKNEEGQNIFRVNSTFNPKFDITFMHPEYCVNTGKRQMTKTGFMVVFELKTENKTLPTFLGRWDEKEQLLDIDILGVDKKSTSDFRAEKNGYSGHHPKHISESPRLFQIEINIPECEIMKGNITFNVNHGHHPDLLKL
jgi:hypothetical protein